MTETEWEDTTDIIAMVDCLRDMAGHSKDTVLDYRWIPNRKKRLWCAALARLNGQPTNVTYSEWERGEPRPRQTETSEEKNIAQVFGWWIERLTRPEVALAKSVYFRDLISNPFFPIVSDHAYLTDPLAHASVHNSMARGRYPMTDDTNRRAVEAHIFRKEWRTEDAVAMARKCYESRDFTGMPIIADALEEAGCENDCVLFHLRGLVGCPECDGTGQLADGGSGSFVPYRHKKCPKCKGEGLLPPPEHIRGCWCLDLILDLA